MDSTPKKSSLLVEMRSQLRRESMLINASARVEPFLTDLAVVQNVALLRKIRR